MAALELPRVSAKAMIAASSDCRYIKYEWRMSCTLYCVCLVSGPLSLSGGALRINLTRQLSFTLTLPSKQGCSSCATKRLSPRAL